MLRVPTSHNMTTVGKSCSATARWDEIFQGNPCGENSPRKETARRDELPLLGTRPFRDRGNVQRLVMSLRGYATRLTLGRIPNRRS